MRGRPCGWIHAKFPSRHHGHFIQSYRMPGERDWPTFIRWANLFKWLLKASSAVAIFLWEITWDTISSLPVPITTGTLTNIFSRALYHQSSNPVFPSSSPSQAISCHPWVRSLGHASFQAKWKSLYIAWFFPFTRQPPLSAQAKQQ